MGGRSRAARLSLGALAALALPTAALAATLNVNSTADELIAGNGQCTLREAIINANGDTDTTAGDCPAGSGADLINVPADTYELVIPSTDITSDLTLRGAGAAMTALVQSNEDRVVYVRSGNVVIERLSVTGPGDGLWNSENLIVSDAIISENGGIGVFDFGDLLLRRSTVINDGGLGLGLRNAGNARIEGTTFSGCVRIWSIEEDFIAQYQPFPIEVSNSTIAGTSSCPAVLYWHRDYATIRGTLLDKAICYHQRPSSGGHNLDSDGSCVGFTDPTGLSNVDPLLGPLKSNGGPTPTHALQLGSPAIDAIPSAACTWDHDGDPGTSEVALTKDQRGGMRPREGNGSAPTGCDIGAYEVAPCADGLDNDGDGLVDFDGGATAGLTPLASPDPSCASALGAAEVTPPSSGCGVGPELALLLPALLALRRRRAKRAGALRLLACFAASCGAGEVRGRS